MGCSYDPMPYTYIPSPAEQWMTDNHFAEGPGRRTSYCTDCGVVLLGDRYGNRYLISHVTSCPVAPRHEIPQKTEEELKAFKQTRYR